MKKISFLIVVLIFSFSTIFAQNKPVNLILDTDIGPDYDDVGAMAIMHSLSDSGQVNILATVASNQSPYVAAVLDVINTYFKRPNIPVGVVRGKSVNISASQKWDSVLVAKYPHKIKNNNEAEDALNLYRKILASQADNSVTIVTIGFLTNMSNLLLSKPDKFSLLNGKELVKKKIKNLVCMAGRFPEGKEFNVEKDSISSKIVFDAWPTPIIFSGFEIGMKIHTGLPLINNNKIKNSPIKDAFAISIPKDKNDVNGRMSWDETAVLVAIKGYKKYYTLVEGRFVCNADGSNTWDKSKRGHYYLVEKTATKEMENIINNLMMR